MVGRVGTRVRLSVRYLRRKPVRTIYVVALLLVVLVNCRSRRSDIDIQVDTPQEQNAPLPCVAELRGFVCVPVGGSHCRTHLPACEILSGKPVLRCENEASLEPWRVAREKCREEQLPTALGPLADVPEGLGEFSGVYGGHVLILDATCSQMKGTARALIESKKAFGAEQKHSLSWVRIRGHLKKGWGHGHNVTFPARIRVQDILEVRACGRVSEERFFEILRRGADIPDAHIPDRP